MTASARMQHRMRFVPVLVFAVLGFPIQAQAPLTVVSVPGLTIEDVLHPEASQLYDLAKHGEIAAVNTAEKKAQRFSLATLSGLPVQEMPIETEGSSLLAALAQAKPDAAPLTLLSLSLDPQNRPRSLRLLNILLYSLRSEDADLPLVILSSEPAKTGSQDTERRLGVVIQGGRGFSEGLLSSASTRTPGLVTNADVRASLYGRFALPDPEQGGGHPFRRTSSASPGEERIARVRELAYIAELNDRTLKGFLPFLFAGIAAGVVAAIWKGKSRLRGVVLLALNTPITLLLAPLLPPPTLLEYALRIFALSCGLGFAARSLEKKYEWSAPHWCGVFLLTAIGVDLLSDGKLLKISLLSGYPLSGIRFYGIGNEYLGLVCGFLLLFFLLPFRFSRRKKLDSSRASRLSLLLTALIFALLCGLPKLGANAGSLVIFTVGIGTAVKLHQGNPVRWRTGLGLALMGLALALFLAALEARLLKTEASHFGAALQTAQEGGGASSLLGIVGRKIGMNLRLLCSISFLASAGVLAAAAQLARLRLSGEIRSFLFAHPGLKTRFGAVGLTALTALLFKDSGVVSASFLLGTVLLGLLYALLDPGPAVPPES